MAHLKLKQLKHTTPWLNQKVLQETFLLYFQMWRVPINGYDVTMYHFCFFKLLLLLFMCLCMGQMKTGVDVDMGGK